MAYAGFDRADMPPLDMMERLRFQSNLVWCGFYLKAPSQSGATWRGNRAALVAQGWGLAPIYVGQQTIGPGSHIVTAAQGSLDGAQAAADMESDGFRLGSYVYLDLENGPPFGNTQSGYVEAWAKSVESGGYRCGIYCSFLFAGQVAHILPQARVWVYHVITVNPHDVPGTAFSAPELARSGFPCASIWQYDDEARLIAFGHLACDLDSSVFADPSAPDAIITPVQAPPIVVPPAAPQIATVSDLQRALNELEPGLNLAVDNYFGPLSREALIAFQATSGITADGILGPQTREALEKALNHYVGSSANTRIGP